MVCRPRSPMPDDAHRMHVAPVTIGPRPRTVVYAAGIAGVAVLVETGAGPREIFATTAARHGLSTRCRAPAVLLGAELPIRAERLELVSACCAESRNGYGQCSLRHCLLLGRRKPRAPSRSGASLSR